MSDKKNKALTRTWYNKLRTKIKNNSIGLIVMAIDHLNFIASLLGTEYAGKYICEIGYEVYNRIGIVFSIFGFFIFIFTHFLQKCFDSSQVFILDYHTNRKKSIITGETYMFLRDKTFIRLVSSLSEEEAVKCEKEIGKEFSDTIQCENLKQYVDEWNNVDSHSDWFYEIEYHEEMNILSIRNSIAKVCRERTGLCDVNNNNCNGIVCKFFCSYAKAVLEGCRYVASANFINCTEACNSNTCMMQFSLNPSENFLSCPTS